jgi:CO dehydrogenase nickel-insertion accessory protein CooC1
MVVEPFFGSIALAGKIVDMAEGRGTRRVMVILNSVPSEKVKQRMETELSGKCIETLGTI